MTIRSQLFHFLWVLSSTCMTSAAVYQLTATRNPLWIILLAWGFGLYVLYILHARGLRLRRVNPVKRDPRREDEARREMETL